MKIIAKVIERLGMEITVNGHRGMAVLYPVRYTRKENGGVEAVAFGRSNPHHFFCFAGVDLMQGVDYGDIVRENGNEYYVLWTDEIRNRLGSYTKTCMRKIERSGA